MSNSLLKTLALCLLLMFGLAAGYFIFESTYQSKPQLALKQVKKAGLTSDTDDVPFLSKDLHRVSRGVQKNSEGAFFYPSVAIYINAFKTECVKLSDRSSILQYPVPFKKLFPEHAFS